MKLPLIVVILGITATALYGEDFTLKFFTDGPIKLHTTLSFEDDGVHLTATAKNESSLPIQKATVCIMSPSMTDGCLFRIWNTAPWAPGAEMNWNMTSRRKISTLSHDAIIEDYLNIQPSPTIAPEADAPHTTQLTNADHAKPLTNETLIRLGKAGLGDEVILNMVNSQSGRYRKTPDDIIALKQSGLSDKVIAAVLNKGADEASDTSGGMPQDSTLSAKIETNARLYIAPMTSNLDEFLSAEVVKQHLPVRVVLEEKDADYILSGLSQKTEVKWYDVLSGSVVGGKDRLEASAKLVRVRDKAFVWAGESGDRSLIFDALKRGGQRKLAERIVSQMKHDLF